jgi:hypothetical protein
MGGGIHLLWIAWGVGMGGGGAAAEPGELFATLLGPRIVAALSETRIQSRLLDSSIGATLKRT